MGVIDGTKAGIPSAPPPGNRKVATIYVDSNGKLVVVYDDKPAS